MDRRLSAIQHPLIPLFTDFSIVFITFTKENAAWKSEKPSCNATWQKRVGLPFFLAKNKKFKILVFLFLLIHILTLSVRIKKIVGISYSGSARIVSTEQFNTYYSIFGV